VKKRHLFFPEKERERENTILIYHRLNAVVVVVVHRCQSERVDASRVVPRARFFSVFSFFFLCKTTAFA